MLYNLEDLKVGQQVRVIVELNGSVTPWGVGEITKIDTRYNEPLIWVNFQADGIYNMFGCHLPFDLKDIKEIVQEV